MKISNFKAYSGSNGFQGYLDLILDEPGLGMVVTGIKIFEQANGARWIVLPQTEWKRRDGTVGYTNQIDYLNKDAEDRIHEFVFTELDKIRKPKLEEVHALNGEVKITDEDVPF